MQHTVESPCPLSAPPPLISLTLTPSLPPPLHVADAAPPPAPSSHWGFHIAGAARRGVPMCSALPPTRHHAFCPPHTSFVSLPGVGGTGRQPLNKPTFYQRDSTGNPGNDILYIYIYVKKRNLSRLLAVGAPRITSSVFNSRHSCREATPQESAKICLQYIEWFRLVFIYPYTVDPLVSGVCVL